MLLGTLGTPSVDPGGPGRFEVELSVNGWRATHPRSFWLVFLMEVGVGVESASHHSWIAGLGM